MRARATWPPRRIPAGVVEQLLIEVGRPQDARAPRRAARLVPGHYVTRARVMGVPACMLTIATYLGHDESLWDVIDRRLDTGRFAGPQAAFGPFSGPPGALNDEQAPPGRSR